MWVLTRMRVCGMAARADDAVTAGDVYVSRPVIFSLLSNQTREAVLGYRHTCDAMAVPRSP